MEGTPEEGVRSWLPSPSIETELGCIYAPVEGTAIPHTEIKDATFAAGVVGEGVGIIPTKGEVVAPFDGQISMFFDTKHAIGLVSDDGALGFPRVPFLPVAGQ